MLNSGVQEAVNILEMNRHSTLIVPSYYGTRLFRKIVLVLFTVIVFSPSRSYAQGSFIFGLECKTGNFWSANFLGLPTSIINSFIYQAQGYEREDIAPTGVATTLRFNRIKVNGKKVDYEGHNYFGFKAKDLFRDFEYSVKLGWQPVQIPVGFYARLGFRHENFETRMPNMDWSKNRLNCLRPGIGIRISPLENMVDGYGWCPVLEIGSTYDYYLSYKGAYGDSKDQINNGISLNAGLGVKLESGIAIMLLVDKENYDLFNKDFVVDGIKPYENTESSHLNVSVSMSFGL